MKYNPWLKFNQTLFLMEYFDDTECINHSSITYLAKTFILGPQLNQLLPNSKYFVAISRFLFFRKRMHSASDQPCGDVSCLVVRRHFKHWAFVILCRRHNVWMNFLDNGFIPEIPIISKVKPKLRFFKTEKLLNLKLKTYNIKI